MSCILVVNKSNGSLSSFSSSFSPSFYYALRSLCRPLQSDKLDDSVMPVKILVTVRTDYSNEVLIDHRVGNFYTDCTPDNPNNHILDDLILLSAKSLIDSLFDCGENISEVIRRTQVYPLGARLFEGEVYVYVNVVIDHTLKSDPKFKIKDSHFFKIKDLYSRSLNPALEEDMIKNLIIVKESSKDA